MKLIIKSVLFSLVIFITFVGNIFSKKEGSGLFRIDLKQSNTVSKAQADVPDNESGDYDSSGEADGTGGGAEGAEGAGGGAGDCSDAGGSCDGAGAGGGGNGDSDSDSGDDGDDGDDGDGDGDDGGGDGE